MRLILMVLNPMFTKRLVQSSLFLMCKILATDIKWFPIDMARVLQDTEQEDESDQIINQLGDIDKRLEKITKLIDQH